MERIDPTEGVSEPEVATPHRPWVKIATVVILAAFILAILAGALFS